MNIKEKLQTLGMELPQPSSPGGSYRSVNVRGNIAYVAIQFPILNDKFLYLGRLGEDIDTDEGYEAMKICALNVISQIHHKVRFDKVEGLNHLDAYYQSSNGWDQAPKVVNGASDLFVEVLGTKGEHSRAIFGVQELPRNLSVGLTCSFTLL